MRTGWLTFAALAALVAAFVVSFVHHMLFLEPLVGLLTMGG